MLGNLGANPVSTTSQQQTESGQTGGSQTATSGVTQNNTAKSSSHASPRRDAFKSLKALFGNVRVQITIWVLSGFSIGWHICEWRMKRLMRSMTPNVQNSATPEV